MPKSSHPVRVAAINFLNPAPLMWDFEHPPLAAKLADRYTLHYTRPALCADELLAARADLGLIPIAELTPDLAIVPGCTIASLDRVRSIQLIVKNTHTLETVRTIAADTASRSSLAYAKILFRKFLGTQPGFLQQPADPIAMLQQADAALLIGDPALLALESREQIEQAIGPCHWIDLAHEWTTRTGLPWVAAVWAVRPEALSLGHITNAEITNDLTASRDHGLAHTEDLVRQWTPRIAVPAETIRHYLTENIHYNLTPDCIEAMKLFRRYAAEIDALPPLPELRFL
ncbi:MULTISPECIES: menaquinone biosynthetic enzyme MqnA/MqnD family protein [Acidobacteriaceae]|uniref:menaquinone biosynthetic enzyme MqnA/MqnD family protein n=1 Tax=Acidobacteriaceae TaxID=204434 RepID=UPI0020B12962|nr:MULTISPECIES: menaquinone biosynthesis protein [Acidobacteriaceae]MDW5267112.1 menaquinone biosynthesis protein [Edaphobacter sp.]